MTIRAKLTLWYSGFLTISSLLIIGGIYYELVIEPKTPHPTLGSEPIAEELDEILFFYAVPAFLITIFGGWWVTRKSLAPVKEITAAATKISVQNLGEQLPRTCNGDEVDRLAAVFNSMFDRLKASFAREREFILHASHEIKTPLMVMRGQIETALRDQQLLPAQREVFENHLEEIVRLAGLVDALSFLAKADAGVLVLEKRALQLDELVEEIIEEAKILAYPRSITTKRDRIQKVKIEGDRHRLRQLLLNLTDNAIKHNVEGGEVSFALEKNGTEVALRIDNTGPGIAPEDLAKLFEPFFRADPAHDPNQDGSGLGLSIARRIVNAHKGTIDIHSHNGKTTVMVRLPLLSPALN